MAAFYYVFFLTPSVNLKACYLIGKVSRLFHDNRIDRGGVNGWTCNFNLRLLRQYASSPYLFESQPLCRSVHLLFHSQEGPFFSPFSDTRVVGKVNFTVPRDFHHTDRHTNLNYRIHRLEWRNKGKSNHTSDCDLYKKI